MGLITRIYCYPLAGSFRNTYIVSTYPLIPICWDSSGEALSAAFEMLVRFFQIVIVFVISSGNSMSQVNDSLSKVLETIYSDDQQYRNRLGYLQQKHGYNSPEMRILLDSMRAKDSVNVILVSKILDEYGWLGPEVVGASGNRALFLVIQHADLDVQLKYQPMLRTAVETGSLKAGSLALLEDRIAVRQGLDQIYGSQIGWNMIDNTYFLFPVIDPDSLDERRLRVGLPSIEIYLRNFNMKWDLEKYKNELTYLREKIISQRKGK